MVALETALIVQRDVQRSFALLVTAQLLRTASRLSNHYSKRSRGVVPNGTMPLFYSGKSVYLTIENIYYGNSEDKDGVVLQVVRK